MSNKDGGPAFPTLVETGVVDAPGQDHDGNKIYRHVDEGMTLRDYFAAQALASIPLRDWSEVKDDREKIRRWVAVVYLIADDMIAERAKG